VCVCVKDPGKEISFVHFSLEKRFRFSLLIYINIWLTGLGQSLWLVALVCLVCVFINFVIRIRNPHYGESL
jgi:hypothetical protein